MKLFIPKSTKQQDPHGKKLTVNLPDVFFAGVLLSSVITTTHKLRFCFGLCDVDDSGALNVAEFFAFVRAAFSGISAIFDTCAPPKELVTLIAERCYRRLSQIAGSRVVDMVGKGNVSREDVIRTVKAHQARAAQTAVTGDAEEARRLSKDAIKTQQPAPPREAPRTGATQQLIFYHILEDFLV